MLSVIGFGTLYKSSGGTALVIMDNDGISGPIRLAEMGRLAYRAAARHPIGKGELCGQDIVIC